MRRTPPAEAYPKSPTRNALSHLSFPRRRRTAELAACASLLIAVDRARVPTISTPLLDLRERKRGGARVPYTEECAQIYGGDNMWPWRHCGRRGSARVFGAADRRRRREPRVRPGSLFCTLLGLASFASPFLKFCVPCKGRSSAWIS